MRFKKVILLTFILFIAVVPINLCLGTTNVSNHEIVVTISINNAYYYAADDDGIENDVAAEFSLDVYRNKFHNKRCSVSFYLLVALYLPSGYGYGYLFLVTCTGDVYAEPVARFFNHATESGIYCVEMTCILPCGPNCAYIGTESYCFDPPGGSDGTDPLTCTIEL
ncbi:MAG: hypothetical protein FK733_17655 [Asgard group archaeon]|nr:hypothetical protein [Asgard group archaeon]